MKLTTYHHVSMLRMDGDLPHLPLYAVYTFMAQCFGIRTTSFLPIIWLIFYKLICDFNIFNLRSRFVTLTTRKLFHFIFQMLLFMISYKLSQLAEIQSTFTLSLIHEKWKSVSHNESLSLLLLHNLRACLLSSVSPKSCVLSLPLSQNKEGL
jgi:hypothetical protein